MSVVLRIVEGPPGPPPDVSRVVATLAWTPSLAVASPDTEVVQVDTLSGLKDAIGYGIGPEAVSRRVRISRVRGLLMSHLPSVAGVISAVVQTGLGPSITVAANDTHPSDDASVIVRIVDQGAPGVATYQLSTSYNVISQGNVQRLYGPPLSMPARLAATVVGAKDLTTLVYALPAVVTGTADLSDPTLYGAGGSLAGKTIIVAFDDGTPETVTIPSGASAPADVDALVAYIDGELDGFATPGDASYTTFPYLVLSGRVIGTGGNVIITGGTALALLGLTVATKAKVVGNVDVVAFNYSGGAALDTLTVIVDEDTTTAQTVTFDNTITNSTLLLAALNGGTTNLTFSINGSNFLVVESDTFGTASTIALGAGTAHTALFGTPTITSPGTGTTTGSAGALDGLTVLLDEDTTTSQTVTFGTGASAVENADDVIAAVSAATNITAGLYSSRSLLQISSDTLGSTSTLSITGGTALTLLGLTITSAVGAEPTHNVEHLGVTITFPPGTYRSGTTYAFSTTSPRPSVSEVEDRLRELEATHGAEFSVVHIAAPFNATDALAIAGALDALGAEWEARQGNPRAIRFNIGVDPSELDSVVKATLATGSFRSRRVDIAARGAYASAGLISGGGRLLRSQSWPSADADALIPFYRDRGERRLDELRAGFPEIFAITADENTALVKLVNATGPRFNVMVVGNPGLQFSGGYSFANHDSAFTDASVRNTTHRAFVVGYAALALNENRTDLDTNSDGTLTQASADAVAVQVAAAIAAEIVPGGATAVQVTVSTSNNFYSTRKLIGNIKFQNRVPAREIEFTIGPGLITDT